LKTTTLKTRIIITKNTHAESKKIAVKVYKVRAKGEEELDVQKQNAEDDALKTRLINT
jgi:hypothetical protein